MLGPPTKETITVQLRRSPSGGIDTRIEHRDEQGGLIEKSEDTSHGLCCFEVIYWAAVEVAIMEEDRDLPRKRAMACPECVAAVEPDEPRPALPSQPPHPPGSGVITPRPPITRHVIGGMLFGPDLAGPLSFGGQLGVDLRFAPWSFEADLQGPFSASTKPNGRTELRTNSLSLTGSVCHWWQRFAVCGVASGGAFISTAEREYNVTSARPFVSVGPRLLYEHPFERYDIRLRVAGEFAATLVKPVFREPYGMKPWRAQAATTHVGLLVVKSF
jgi:hypothetical protein